METDRVVALVVGLNCLLGLLRGLRARGGTPNGFTVVFAANLALLGLVQSTDPELTTSVVAPVWIATVMLPIVLARWWRTELRRGRFGRAAFLARASALLHPADGWSTFPRFVTAVRAAQEGDFDRARQLAAALSGRSSLVRGASLQLVAALDDDDAAILELVRREGAEALMRDAGLVVAFLRAAARRADAAGVVELARGVAFPFEQQAAAQDAEVARTLVAAHLGLVDTVVRTVESSLGSQLGDVSATYVVVALQRAGRREEAEEVARRAAAATGSALVRRLLERAIEQPLPPFDLDSLDPAALEVVRDVERRAAADESYGLGSGRRDAKPVFTRALAAVLGVVFAVELARGGATDTRTLYEMGALVVPLSATPGEWWRVVTAAFLHVGWLHFGLNLLGLLWLGGQLERVWRRRLVVGVYAAAVLVSGAAVVLAAGDEVRIFAGASGGIMGLLGAIGGRLLVGSAKEATPMLRRQLGTFLAIVGLQMVFDSLVPNVSSTAHLVVSRRASWSVSS
ncbi:MAG: rhomboid family intramembrane serine protease [Planctomycetota bacterium]